jgi:hypothetical protein
MEKNEAGQPGGISRDVQGDTLPANIKAEKKEISIGQQKKASVGIFHTVLCLLMRR